MAWIWTLTFNYFFVVLWTPSATKEKVTVYEMSEKLQNTIVKQHNNFRKQVNPSARNMVKMMWSPEIALNAYKMAKSCKLHHSSHDELQILNYTCGENIYIATRKNSWHRAIQMWHDEHKHFKYGVGAINNFVTGHYTQVVWFISFLIGCSFAKCGTSNPKYLYVCQYCPGGNTNDDTPYKEGMPCADCLESCEDRLCTNPCIYQDKYSNCEEESKKYGCDDSLNEDCPATCSCENEIK
ncbi:cysteine-rich venom protein-like isoform X1 [Polypterus senegalus]